MKNGEWKLQKNQVPEGQENRLLVADIVRYLSGLAKLNEEGKTGNPELCKGLRMLAQVLRPYADYPALELNDIIKKKRSRAVPSKEVSNRSKSMLLPELESIGQEDLERILDNEGYTKRQIVEIGVRRFGISRSKLERNSKEDTRRAVRAALEHEKSLDVISMEAMRGGRARSA